MRAYGLNPTPWVRSALIATTDPAGLGKPVDASGSGWDGVRMSKQRSKLAQAALVSNGMVWFGASFMLFAIAAEQTAAVFAGTWLNVLGWAIILLVAVGLAVVGVIENVNIRAGRKYKTRPRS